MLSPASLPRRLLRRLLYSEALRATNTGYRLFLRRQRGVNGPFGYPNAPWRNAVLKTSHEWKEATAQVIDLGLLLHPTPEKHWDCLAMLACILERTTRSARILDAGAMPYSVLLPWLFLYGYKNLIGIGLSYERPVRLGPIRYEWGDITRMRFRDKSIDVVLCESVLEHGVDVGAFLHEASRVLSPDGLLMISVDYFTEPIPTEQVRPYGLSYRIFTPSDIQQLIEAAKAVGLKLLDPIDLSCQERAVGWNEYDLEFTFVMLTFTRF